MTQPTPDPPFLFVDAFPYDFDDPRTPQLDDPQWGQILSARYVRGVILKVSDGVNYGRVFREWFTRNFTTLIKLAGIDRGKTVLLGGYHYVQVFDDPRAQADAYCDLLHDAGHGDHDIMPIVDVEGGNERARNRRATAAQVVQCVTEVVERIKARTGRRVMLYGRGLMRDLSIMSRMGCDAVWNPSYTRVIEMNGLSRVDGLPGPWKIDDVALWQYLGDGEGDVTATHLPTAIGGRTKLDISVVVDGDRRPTWDRAVARLT